MEIDENGKRRVRFTPIAAADTKEAMEQLIFAYIDARDNPRINKLLLTPCVILDFLCIHPFSDDHVIIRTKLEKPSKINGLALI